MKYLAALILLLSTLVYSGIQKELYFELDYYGGINPKDDYQSLRLKFYARPTLHGKWTNGTFSYHFSANLMFDPLAGKDNMFGRIDNLLREVWIGFHLNYFDIFLGQRFVNWGKADFYSPVNMINPVDTTLLSMDNLGEAKYPDIMAQVIFYPTDLLSLELVYVPFLRQYYYPLDEIEIPSITFNNLAIDIDLIHESVIYPSRAVNSLHSKLNLMSGFLDMSAVYSYYIDQFIDVDSSAMIEIRSNLNPSNTLTNLTGPAVTTNYRAHNFGLCLATDLRGWGFAADFSYKRTSDPDGTIIEIKNSEIIYNLQVSKTFFTKLYSQANFIHRRIIHFDAEQESRFSDAIVAAISPMVQEKLLQPVSDQIYLFFRLHTDFIHQRLFTAVNTIFGFAPGSSSYKREIYIAPRISWKFTDKFTISGGADLYLGGAPGGQLGRNAQNDNFYIRLRYDL